MKLKYDVLQKSIDNLLYLISNMAASSSSFHIFENKRKPFAELQSSSVYKTIIMQDTVPKSDYCITHICFIRRIGFILFLNQMRIRRDI